MTTPNTSPANVARVLRETADALGMSHWTTAARAFTLVNALDAQAAVTWEERTERAIVAWNRAAREGLPLPMALDMALRLACPELAPSDA